MQISESESFVIFFGIC